MIIQDRVRYQTTIEFVDGRTMKLETCASEGSYPQWAAGWFTVVDTEQAMLFPVHTISSVLIVETELQNVKTTSRKVT